MAPSYEIWLCDDRGVRFNLLENVTFFSYARTVTGYSNCTIGLGFENFAKEIPQIFKPDWRIDIWRSPIEGIKARREKSFFLRKFNVYTRKDGVRMLELFGRDAKDVLRRQYVSTSEAGLTDTIDNIMKYLVSTYLVGTDTVPTGEIDVESDSSDGPSVTAKYKSKNLLDALNELHDASVTLNLLDPTNNKVIYFDLLERDNSSGGGFGYRFNTYPRFRGGDRTNGLLFCEENGNIQIPTYYEDYLDQVTVFDVYNEDDPTADATATSPDSTLSRWSYIRAAQSSSETDVNMNTVTAQTELNKQRARKVINCEFVNSPGGPEQPRSLYGVDWDFGDLLPVKYAGKSFNAEVKVVYVSVNDKGEETITGRSLLGE